MEAIASRLIVETPLGKIAVCAANGKLVEVGFVSDGSLTSFSENDLDAAITKQAGVQLEEYFAGKRQSFDLPVSFSGTEFQRSIWQEIAKIPFGQTASYKDLAVRIGKPQAARAVGGAVGSNPIGIIVGCHRVMGSSGKITGYSGGQGIPTKVKLLELEGIEYK